MQSREKAVYLGHPQFFHFLAVFLGLALRAWSRFKEEIQLYKFLN